MKRQELEAKAEMVFDETPDAAKQVLFNMVIEMLPAEQLEQFLKNYNNAVAMHNKVQS